MLRAVETLSGKPARFEGGLHELADGVHGWLQPNGEWGEANAALVVGDGESLLVDTLWTPSLAREMLAAMAPLTAGAPIARVVNTHADGDHWWGNQEVVGQSSADVEIVATEAAAEEMGAVTPGAMAMLRRVGQGLGAAGGAPIPFRGRSTMRSMGELFDQMTRPFDWSDVELTPATRTFEGTLELEVGGRRVELVEVGPAHTPGDAIVHVPDASVAIAADILFIGVTPIMWSGSPERWVGAIERVLEREPRTILPGHGPVTDAAGAREVQDYFRFVDAAARRRFAAGDSVKRAALQILASEEFRTSPWAAWDGPERIVGTMHSMRRSEQGQTDPPSTQQRMAVFREIARVRLGAGLAA
jgi:cyclase